MKNPLLQINQPADVDLGRNGSLNLGIRWKADFAGRFTEGFERLQKEADGEFVRMVKPYVPKRTGALVGSTDDHTVLGSGQIIQATPYAAAQYYRLPLGQGVREDGPKGKVTTHKDMGLVNEVFTQDILESMKGDIGVGHVRYSTA